MNIPLHVELFISKWFFCLINRHIEVLPDWQCGFASCFILKADCDKFVCDRTTYGLVSINLHVNVLWLLTCVSGRSSFRCCFLHREHHCSECDYLGLQKISLPPYYYNEQESVSKIHFVRSFHRKYINWQIIPFAKITMTQIYSYNVLVMTE